MAVITISSLYAAGGVDVAKALARKLNYRYFDRNMVDPISKELGLTHGEAQVLRDGHHGIFFSLVDNLSSALLKGVMGNDVPKKVDQKDQTAFMEQIEEMVLLLAEDNNLVIVGWGSQVILHDVPHAVHVRIVADLEDRIENTVKRKKCSEVSAREIIHRREENSRRYVKLNWEQDWNDPNLYDMVLNMSHLGQKHSEEMVMSLLRVKGLLED